MTTNNFDFLQSGNWAAPALAEVSPVGVSTLVRSRGFSETEKGEDEEVNKELSRAFSLLAVMLEREGESYRATAFRKVADIIKHTDFVILSSYEMVGVKDVGEKSLALINEFLQTGHMVRLDELMIKHREFTTTYDLFRSIFGVGPVAADKFYRSGYRSIDDLWFGAYDKLTAAQRLGILWREHIALPVPRAEIQDIEREMRALLDPVRVKFVIAGSYRRGDSVSGDVDVLVQGESSISMSMILEALRDILPATLALGPTKFMGMVKLNEDSNAHRIDIRLIPTEQFPYALMYFTGSKNFNKLVRSRAIERRLKLNEYSMRQIDGNGDAYGSSYPAKDEADILQYLGIRYYEPHERIKSIVHIE